MATMARARHREHVVRGTGRNAVRIDGPKIEKQGAERGAVKQKLMDIAKERASTCATFRWAKGKGKVAVKYRDKSGK